MTRIKTINDLPDGEELFLGPCHGQFCNRYLRKGDTVEVENVYRYGKKQPTKVYTASEFNAWRAEIIAMAGA